MAWHRHDERAEVVKMDPKDALMVLAPKKLFCQAGRYLRLEAPSQDRSTALLSSAEAFVIARLTFEAWAKRIAKHPGAADYRGRKDRSRELGRDWAKAKERLCRIETMLPRRRSLAPSISAAWTAPGLMASSHTALACIYGIAERAVDFGSVHVSQRDLSLESDVTLVTAQRHLGKLQEAGYIWVAQAPTARSATRYALCSNKLASNYVYHPSHPGGSSPQVPGG